MAGDSLERKLYRVGREVFAEGDHGNCAYIVEVGRIAISKDIEGREVVLGTIGPNGLFGEMALLDDAPRMASATAITDAVCVMLPGPGRQE
ncbi:MAG: CheY-like receiver [Rhodospirillaceae bacterium]|nr:MAG: CheY-like receiver [Rhodospirillaceae bacterium]